MPVTLVNGEKTSTVEISDRGFQYGDGLFETLEIEQGRPVFWRQHLARLEQGCRKLGIPFPDVCLLESELLHLIDGKTSRAVLKLIITRGSGGRGYRPPEPVLPTRVFSLYPFPDYLDSLRTQGIRVRFCKTRLGHNPNLAGLKHLNRLEQIMARAEWQDSDIHEGLMLDIHDHVIEGTMSNLFCVKDGTLLTPCLDVNGIEGIIRSIILRQSDLQGIQTRITRLERKDILQADEVFLSNSLIGVWPVRQIEQMSYKTGPITDKIIALLASCRQKDLGKSPVKYS